MECGSSTERYNIETTPPKIPTSDSRVQKYRIKAYAMMRPKFWRAFQLMKRCKGIALDILL
jgi:1-aminocyclopropane-1-carboxylate deaminase/D-cysteine desulfhydrase-like pyridoxal-dependent ACC family enzyme